MTKRAAELTLSTLIVVIVLLVALLSILIFFRTQYGAATSNISGLSDAAQAGVESVAEDFSAESIFCETDWQCQYYRDYTDPDTQSSYTKGSKCGFGTDQTPEGTYSECASICKNPIKVPHPCKCVCLPKPEEQ